MTRALWLNPPALVSPPTTARNAPDPRRVSSPSSRLRIRSSAGTVPAQHSRVRNKSEAVGDARSCSEVLNGLRCMDDVVCHARRLLKRASTLRSPLNAPLNPPSSVSALFTPLPPAGAHAPSSVPGPVTSRGSMRALFRSTSVALTLAAAARRSFAAARCCTAVRQVASPCGKLTATGLSEPESAATCAGWVTLAVPSEHERPEFWSRCRPPSVLDELGRAQGAPGQSEAMAERQPLSPLPFPPCSIHSRTLPADSPAPLARRAATRLGGNWAVGMDSRMQRPRKVSKEFSRSKKDALWVSLSDVGRCCFCKEAGDEGGGR